MFSILKRLKIIYATYNLFHKKQLLYNEAQYKALGISKKYYSPVSSSDFKHLNSAISSSRDSTSQVAERLNATIAFKNFDDDSRQSLFGFSEKGYAVLRNYFPAEVVDNINIEIDSLLKTHTIKPLANKKIMFAYRHSKLLNDIGNDPDLKKILAALLDGNAILFQSINFFKGSEQHTHSDSIHMTTYPYGGLLGVWIALEDIDANNGPLHYYPSSHKLPYYMNEDYKNEGNKWLIGNKSYAEYEKMIEGKIKLHNITKQTFFAGKGDVLIWHANLFHGGEPQLDKARTRKSMVLHYFREGDICFHEITQRPALMYIEQ